MARLGINLVSYFRRISLKAHRQVSKKWCFEKCFSCDKACISILPISPRGSRRAHISPEENWNFPVKLVEIRMLLFYKNKARGDIFEEKGISEQFC